MLSDNTKKRAIDGSRFLLNTADFVILTYFTALILVNQISGPAVSIIWYVAIVLSAFFGIYCCNFKMDNNRILFLMLMVISGIICIMATGNSTIKSQVLLVLLFFVSLSFSSASSEYVFLAVFYANVIIIGYRIMTVGVQGGIFVSSSENFVSVFLIYPLVLYYVYLESHKKEIRILPAFIYWALSLIARGRGGIICATFLLLCIMLNKYYSLNEANKLLIAIVSVTLICMIVINTGVMLSHITRASFFQHFQDRGLQSSRIIIWKDYIDKVVFDKQSLLFGPDIKETVAYKEFAGNPHNSFINIHLNNGIVMLIAVLLQATWSFITGLRQKQYIYVCCLTALLLRGLTDAVFWPMYGSSVLFYMLFPPITGVQRESISIPL